MHNDEMSGIPSTSEDEAQALKPGQELEARVMLLA